MASFGEVRQGMEREQARFAAVGTGYASSWPASLRPSASTSNASSRSGRTSYYSRTLRDPLRDRMPPCENTAPWQPKTVYRSACSASANCRS
jgi:hypothetical protein